MTREQVKRKIQDGLKLTYYDLAVRWGVTSAMVSNFLNGKSVSARLDQELAKLLKCSVDKLPKRNGGQV